MRRLLAICALTLACATAQGAGLEVPTLGARAVGRAGAFTARADDPTAVFHNPGALRRLRGTQLAYDHNLLWAHARFTRAESSIPSADHYPDQDPLAPVENRTPLFALGGFMAATSDLGLEDWTFGLSIFGPSGTGKLDFPVKGGQRYMLTKFEAYMVYYGLSAAWGTDTFGVGITAQWADLIALDYSLIADGQPGGSLNPYASGSDVEATMSLSDRFAPTALAGVWWAPSPAWQVGLSGRIVPVRFEPKGDIELSNVEGQSGFTAQQLRIADSSAATTMTLPITARLGARYLHLKGKREIFDVELDVVYEAWSTLRDQRLDLEGQIVLFANEPAQDVTIERRWRDTLSARLGGTWHLSDTVGLSTGALYEQGATPTNYSNLDFMSFDRLGLAGGLEWAVLGLDLTVSYMHIFQEDRVVSERFGKVLQQRPVAQCPAGCGGFTGVPANAGRFESGYDLVSVGVTAKL